MKRLVGLSLVALSLLQINACTNTVKYGNASRSETIKTEIGTADFQQATQRMARKMLEFPMVESLSGSKRLTIAIDTLTDQTGDKLDLEPMRAAIIRQLTETGKFKLASDESVTSTRTKMTPELDYNAVTEVTAQRFAEATESDLLLYGTVANIIRTKPNSKEVYYRISLNLWDSNTKKLLWKDDHEQLKSQRKAVFGI